MSRDSEASSHSQVKTGYRVVKFRPRYVRMKIPVDWHFSAIGDICWTSSGGTPPRERSEYYKGKIPWIKTGELNDGYLTNTEECLSEAGLLASAAKILPPGTLLFAMYGATIGKTCITQIEGTTNQACCALIPKAENTIDPYYLQQYLIYRRPLIVSLGEGAGQPNTSQDFLREFQIGYPSFSEQRKISLIISKVDELIRKTDEILEQTQRLKKGLMQRLLTRGIGHNRFKKIKWFFGTEIEIPEQWECIKLSEVTTKIHDMDHKMPPKVSRGIPFITGGYLARNTNSILEIDTNIPEMEFITDKDFEIGAKKFDAEKGDLLFSRYGTVGITKLINGNEKFLASYSIALIKPIHKIIFPLFLCNMLNSSIVQTQISFLKEQSSNINLHLSKIKEIRVLRPPINEQRQIAEIGATIERSITKSRKYAEYLQSLKKGLMQKLLTGQIRVRI